MRRRSVEYCLLLPPVAEGIPAPNVQGRTLNLQWPNGPGSTLHGRSHGPLVCDWMVSAECKGIAKPSEIYKSYNSRSAPLRLQFGCDLAEDQTQDPPASSYITAISHIPKTNSMTSLAGTTVDNNKLQQLSSILNSDNNLSYSKSIWCKTDVDLTSRTSLILCRVVFDPDKLAL